MDNQLEDEVQTDGLPVGVKLMMVVAAVVLAGFVALVMFSFEGKTEAEKREEWVESEREPSSSDVHESLYFVWDEPFTVSPLMQTPTAEQLKSKEQVIGVAVGDQAHAYVLNEKDRENMTTITTLIGKTPIVIVHDYMMQQTRVMKGDGSEVIDVRRGGRQEGGMKPVILYEGNRYRFDATQLPLEDYSYSMTTLDAWTTEHPSTTVYVIPDFVFGTPLE